MNAPRRHVLDHPQAVFMGGISVIEDKFLVDELFITKGAAGDYEINARPIRLVFFFGDANLVISTVGAGYRRACKEARAAGGVLRWWGWLGRARLPSWVPQGRRFANLGLCPWLLRCGGRVMNMAEGMRMCVHKWWRRWRWGWWRRGTTSGGFIEGWRRLMNDRRFITRCAGCNGRFP